jgi:hypothetical protein
MADRCVHHPGRESVAQVVGNHYCQQCRDGQMAAVRRVDRHVAPPECFVTYRGSDEWAPLYGTGCAHWVAHQLDVHAGRPHNRCLRGHTLRVRDLVRALSRVSQLSRVREADVWVSPQEDHCGLVCRVQRNERSGERRIWITHDSVKQRGVATDEFATHFQGKGAFYRVR